MTEELPRQLFFTMEKIGHQFTAKELAVLIIPLIADSFLSITIGMADTIMVSTCGEAAVSGVSLVDSISNLLITVFSAFATGGAVVVSQYIGRGESEHARNSAKNLIYISIIISVLMTAVILPVRSHMIDILFGSIERDVKAYTDDYFVPILISYPFLAVYSGLTALSRSERKSFRTMMVSLMMNAINIGGNAVLIHIVGMGPRGAGIASLASRVAGCAVMYILMMNRNEELNVRGLQKGPFSPYLIRRILSIGIPSGLEGAAFHVGKIMVQSLTATLGTSAIAINAVAGNFNAYSNIPGNGINLAIITIVGQCRGQNNIKDIKYYTRLLTGLVFIATAAINLPLFIFSPSVISFYGLKAGSLTEAIPICQLCLIMCTTIWPFAFTLPNMLKAVGDVRFILLASFSSMWIFRVGGAYLLVRSLGMGVEGIWYAMYMDWTFRGLLYLIRVRSGRWQTKNVI